MTEPFDERDKRELDMQLDRELEDTFPASDPLTITRFPRRRRSVDRPPIRSDTDGAPSGNPGKVRPA
jgi:hypothetical protein